MFRIIAFALLLCLPTTSWAAKRVALIIGNDSYSDVAPLQKAVADADAIAAKMQAAGYETIVRTDAGRRDINLAISRFTGLLEPGDTAFVFFAGHGVQIDGENYLLPTDIAAPADVSEGFITAESIALSDLLARIRRTGARTTLAIIDACRDNPFAASTGRSIGGARGLARLAAPEGTFVMFSAGAGQQALDRLSDADENANSVFTRALLPKLAQDGLELRDMIFQVREEVRDLARTRNHQQFPAYYDELLGDFYIRPASAVVPPAPVPESQPPAQKGQDIRADFQLTRTLGTQDAFARFIETYKDHPDQFVVSLAKDLMAAMPAQETPPTVTPPKPAEDEAQEIMRATQIALNRLGCNAGGADGIAGRRTRAAFAAFLSASNTDLKASDLGSPRALEVLKRTSGTICKAVVSPPAPTPKAPSIVGTWRFSAKCPLFIRTTGTSQFSSAGGNKFVGSMQDSLGQNGRINGTMNGQNFQYVIRTPSAQATVYGTISADGNTTSSQSSVGCKTTAQRIR